MAKIKAKPKIPDAAQEIAAEILSESVTHIVDRLDPEIRQVLDALLDMRVTDRAINLTAIARKVNKRFGTSLKRSTLRDYVRRRQDG